MSISDRLEEEELLLGICSPNLGALEPEEPRREE